MQNILLLLPTNNAVDLIEDRLQQCLPVFDEKISRLVMVSPTYRDRHYKDDMTFCERLRSISDNLLPLECIKRFFNGITLCTIGSIFREFLFRDAEENWLEMMPYQCFLVDGASQVSDEDLFRLLNSILFALQEYEKTWPRILLGTLSASSKYTNATSALLLL